LDIANHPFLVPPSFSVQAHLSKLEPTSSEGLPLGHWKVHTSLLILENLNHTKGQQVQIKCETVTTLNVLQSYQPRLTIRVASIRIIARAPDTKEKKRPQGMGFCCFLPDDEYHCGLWSPYLLAGHEKYDEAKTLLQLISGDKPQALPKPK